MFDLTLLFPPQWSPFQPALSIPTLTAWLRPRGYAVCGRDLNIEFHHWIFGDSAQKALGNAIEAKPLAKYQKDIYASFLDCGFDFYKDVASLLEADDSQIETPQDAVFLHYRADRALNRYLGFIGEVSGEFTFSTSDFSFGEDEFSSGALRDRLSDPPELLKTFVEEKAREIVEKTPAKFYGLSCIGRQQIYFSLLFGAALKKKTSAPVIIGGSVFRQIYETGHLSSDFFGRYFDIIVRHDGEIVLGEILSSDGAPQSLSSVPGLIFKKGESLISTAGYEHPKGADLPVPDFSDLPLKSYIVNKLTLPVFASRGCYWSKCAFCYNHSVYATPYRSLPPDDVRRTLTSLSETYGVKLFSFNDDALPPKTFRAIGQNVPASLGFNLTALVRCESYFKTDDYSNAFASGFRTLYVGLETPNDRVLKLMNKGATRATIVDNLQDSLSAGIWTHCYILFGFPGEKEEEAGETYEFVMNNREIVGSFSASYFLLLHDSPVYQQPQHYQIEITPPSPGQFRFFHDFTPKTGINRESAEKWCGKLRDESQTIPQYRSAFWISREHLLSLTGMMPKDELVENLNSLIASDGVPMDRPLSDFLSLSEKDGYGVVINRLAERTLVVKGKTYAALQATIKNGVNLSELGRLGENLRQILLS